MGSSLANKTNVFPDGRHGGYSLASHLWNRGYRVVVGVSPQPAHFTDAHDTSRPMRGEPDVFQHGKWFLKYWAEFGGRWRIVRNAVHGDGEISVSAEELARALREQPEATAIQGFRDVDAVKAQQALLDAGYPDVSAIEMNGYFDTPWSRATYPPDVLGFSSPGRGRGASARIFSNGFRRGKVRTRRIG